MQAIATAKRLGAKVTAYDTRPVVEEQVKSLGAQFLKIDVGETGQTKEGYAKALPEGTIAKTARRHEKSLWRIRCGPSRTAQVFGRRAPVLITGEMLNAMKPGSVVVDLAIENRPAMSKAQILDQVTDRKRREDCRDRPICPRACHCTPARFIRRT
ncbi:MAG: hypothetical protein WDM76_02515 [Limisphaerales bacterium]